MRCLVVLTCLLAVATARPRMFFHIYEECAKSANVNEEGIAKMKELLKVDLTAKISIADFRKRHDMIKEAVKSTGNEDKLPAFEKCIDDKRPKPAILFCANSTGISESGKNRLTALWKRARNGTDDHGPARKTFPIRLLDDAKKILNETDSDKAEVFDKCVREHSKKHLPSRLMKDRRHHRKDPKHTTPADEVAHHDADHSTSTSHEESSEHHGTTEQVTSEGSHESTTEAAPQ